MKYREFLKREYPDFYEAIDMVLSTDFKDIIFKSANEYAKLMRISNDTDKLPEAEIIKPLIGEVEYEDAICDKCKKPFKNVKDTYRLCVKCHSFV